VDFDIKAPQKLDGVGMRIVGHHRQSFSTKHLNKIQKTLAFGDGVDLGTTLTTVAKAVDFMKHGSFLVSRKQQIQNQGR